MNPRRVHELMRLHFPAVSGQLRDWKNVAEASGVREDDIRRLVDQYIQADDVLVEVHRRIGSFLPKADAVSFIAQHIGQGEIRVADRDFTGFVVVAVNGVATGWSAPDLPSSAATVQRDDK